MRMPMAALAGAIILAGSGATQAQQAPPAQQMQQAPPGYEMEPVHNAKDLATPELLQGPHFTVDPKVPVKGFIERFTIRSTYGTFEAHGLHMLPIPPSSTTSARRRSSSPLPGKPSPAQ